MGYSYDEQETVLVYNQEDKNWTAYSTVQKHISKIIKLCDDLEILETENNRPISVRGTLKEKRVAIRKERVMSEEQRIKSAKRLAKAREIQS